MKDRKIASLRARLLEQIKVQMYADAALCKELIALSERARDPHGAAMGHIWLAESYLLHEENKLACSRALTLAKGYINQQQPSEVLESYYSIQYKLHNALYDTQTAFDYCLKSLEVAEQLYENPDLIHPDQPCFFSAVENRFVKYYGNIGINFFNQGNYKKALLYCVKALTILETLGTANLHAECLLRLNIIISLIRTDAVQDIMHHIHRMEQLPATPELLKIYVDYAYVNYYLYQRDKPKVAAYLQALLGDQIERHADRLTAVDFFIDVLKPVLELNMRPQARQLLQALERLIREDEIRPLLNLTKLKIVYANTFHKKSDAQALYEAYWTLYRKHEAVTHDLIANGLELRLKLNEMELENIRAKARLHALEDIANYDGLTKIFNRRYLEQTYQTLLQGNVSLLHLAMIDIDYFKEYNDFYGHLAGDDILKTIAQCLQEALTDQMIACRYGGDEFVVLSWSRDFIALDAYAQTVVAALHAMGIEHKMSLCAKEITVSIGIASQDVEDPAQIPALFQQADKALYTAKAQGRNQIVKSS